MAVGGTIRSAIVLVLCAFAMACGQVATPPAARASSTSVPPTPEELVKQAAAALGGAAAHIERRGNPALAFALLERAKSGGASDSLLPSVFALEARAAAIGGDYARAQRAAASALALGSTRPGLRDALSRELPMWRELETAQSPTLWLFDEELRIRDRSFPEFHDVTFDGGVESPDAYAVSTRALAALSTSNATLELSRTDGQHTDWFLQVFAKQVQPACTTEIACPWDGYFQCEQLVAAGRIQAAVACWQGLAAASGTDAGHAALALMRAGDAMAAPQSGPLELNLAVYNATPTNLALEAAKATPEFDAVPAESLARARESYAKARALTPSSCDRCRTDLDTREAYLLVAQNQAAAAVERFLDAAHTYDTEGDLQESSRARAAAAGASLLSTGARAGTIVSQLSDDLARREEVGDAIGAAWLLARVAAMVEVRDHDARRAEQAFDLALTITDRQGLRQVGAGVREQKAAFLQRQGRRREALLLRREFREARTVYLSLAAGLTIFASDAQRDADLSTSRQSLIDVTYSDEAAYYADGDIVHAREANEQLRALVRSGGPTKIGPFDILTLADQNEVQLLLGEDRIAAAQEAVKKLNDPMLEASVRLFSDDKAGVLRIARKESAVAVRDLTAATRSDSKAESLQFQWIRSRLARWVDFLALADAPGEARVLLERIDRAWEVAPSTRGREWLYGDARTPWALDVAEGEIAEKLGELPVAEKRFLHAEDAIAKAAAGQGDSYQREGFDDDMAVVDRAVVRVLLKEHRGLDALLALESTRGRVFRGQLVAAAAAALDPVGARLLRRSWQADAVAESLRRSAAGGDAAASAKVNDGEAAAAALRSELRVKFPNLDAAVTLREPVGRDGIDRARKAIDEAAPAALVAYFVSGDFGAAWVLRPQGELVVRPLPVGGKALRATIANLYNRLSSPQPEWKEPARSLYRTLVAPIADLLPVASPGKARPRMGVIPFSGLNVVPFAALLDGDHLLVDRMDVFYEPSLSAFLDAAGRPGRPLLERVEAFGLNTDGLTYAEDEARAVLPGVGAQVGPMVTRANVLAAADHASMIHLATHAVQNEGNPFLSRIVLADGALTIEDVLGVPWRAGLVTLSACETAGGELTRADEFTGLSRALLAAGVRSVLTTNWRIDDAATAALMGRFYGHIREGRDPVGALGEAQREMVVSKSAGAHPGVWAPFAILGADR